MDCELPFTLDSEDFGSILYCAVKYALKRKTYIVSTVVDFITPLLPHISNNTLNALDMEISEASVKLYGCGDSRIDKPLWMSLLGAVRAEKELRGIGLYKIRWGVHDAK